MPEEVSLPPELWLEILEWVILDARPLTAEYVRFQPISPHDTVPAASLVSAFSLVSKEWNTILKALVVRDIKIHSNAKDLLEILKAPQPGRKQAAGTNGELVRRVTLPFQTTVTVGGRGHSPYLGILRSCPTIEVLVRPAVEFERSMRDSLKFTYEPGMVDFPCLKRLEWWNESYGVNSSGVNSLGLVLQNAPNLRYLVLASFGEGSQAVTDEVPVDLPNLDTLRLNGVSAIPMFYIITRWNLPSLSRLILDVPVIGPLFPQFSDLMGSQLQVLELGKHVRFMMKDEVCAYLRTCPNLKEINYHVYFTAVPEPTDEVDVFPMVETVGLSSASNMMVLAEDARWEMVQGHINFLAGKSLPRLKRVVLHGKWEMFDDASFQSLIKPLGARIELWNGA
ncbi:hypothetical protein FA15DRAFT_615363 [Coprinopsis marcescibilis]|uniref:F-box domain-containing protein n=1 Tax=Coprinopsis marcescibilis TaxID=230819 RepID=A0A5C3L278_COPMA|nr:hypothetical protein FA15DRAFT_615363 [Coprinopsis marcescibilis]